MTPAEEIKKIIDEGGENPMKLMNLFFSARDFDIDNLPHRLQNVANAMDMLKHCAGKEKEPNDKVTNLLGFAYSALMNMEPKQLAATLEMYFEIIGADFEIHHVNARDLQKAHDTTQ